MKFNTVTYRRHRDPYPHTRAFFGPDGKQAATVLLRELEADEDTLDVEMVERTRTPRIRSKPEAGQAA